MSRESTYLESLRKLRLPTLRPYLQSHGWVRGPDYRGTLAIFTKGADSLDQLLVPIHPELDDFTEQMAKVISRLAESEGRSERSVLHDLYAGQTDTVRYRMESPASARGTLPLDQGIALLEGARRSLLAAACTVLAPQRSYHPRMSLTPVDDFVGACELAQTEEGSFGIVLRCPLQTQDQEYIPAPQDPPFARRATDTLVSSVSTLVEAINTDRVDSIINPDKPDATRITSNLCDALIKMQPDSETGSLELSMSWATALPKPTHIPGSVKIRGDVFPTIAEISKQLRGPAAGEAAQYLASVDALRGTQINERGQRYGEVRVSVLLGDDEGIVRARAVLDVEKYKIADSAHMGNQYVIITGVLSRSSRLATLRDVTDLQLMSPQLGSSSIA